MKFTVAQDTREKNPWSFNFCDEVKGIAKRTMETGDYTALEIMELEELLGKKILAVERKRNTGEICSNVGQYKDRFLAEMERMTDYEHRYIICEFTRETLSRFPQDSGIPEEKWKYLRMNPKFIQMQIDIIEAKYEVKVIYCNDAKEAQDEFIKIVQGILNAYS